jgi:spermidine synthase
LWSVKDHGSRLLRLGSLAAGLLLVLAMTLSTRGWATMVAASGRAREWRRAFTSFHDFRAAVEARSTVRFYRDDVFASVLVGEQSGGRRYLRINGKVDASNGDDIDTQILAGHLGILTHPSEVKKVLLVGVGAGVTAGSILAHPIERLDVVEISPAVVDAAKFFSPDNRDALADPRCHVHLEDARTFLMLSREKYDLIVSVPSNPWVSGVSGLFSRDFFRVAREHLAEGGRVVQWIHTYESNEEMLRLVLRTLRDSFEHGTTWVGPDDLVLIASRAPQRPDFEVMRQRLARPSVAVDLARIHVHEVTTLLARQVQSDGFQKRFGGEGRINTDDHNLLEYGSPIAYFTASELQVPDERTNSSHGAALELARWTHDQPLTAAQLEDAWRSLSWVHPPEAALVRSMAEAWLESAPGSKDAAVAVTRSALASGDVSRARAALVPFIALGEREPEVVSQWLLTRRAEARREGAPWHLIDVSDAVELGRSVLAEQPDAGAVREQLEKLESLH